MILFISTKGRYIMPFVIINRKKLSMGNQGMLRTCDFMAV